MARLNEHDEHCRNIVEELTKYYNGQYYKCAHCGETVEDNQLFCHCCDNQIDLFDPDTEPLTLWDYFTDVLDIDYLIGSDRRTLKGVRILVAFGGPNIYIDTIQCKVTLQWWNESGEAWIPSEICNEIDSIFEDVYYC